MSELIKVKSGIHELSSINQLVNLLINSVFKAILRALDNTLPELLEVAAKDTGRFRKQLDRSFREQTRTRLVQRLGEGFNIQLKFNLNHIRINVVDPKSGISYGILHINRGAFNRPPYRNPTTPNTRPVDLGEWMRKLFVSTNQSLGLELRLDGFEVK